MFDTLSVTTDARGVAVLTLNRPDKHNAMSGQMISELTEAAAMIAADDEIRVVILTGAGKSFCAGGDLGWMQDQIAADPSTRMAEARKLAEMLYTLNRLPKPLIGRINGQAFGGGVGLISVCDVAVGVKGAKFGLTETRLGLIPATIGPYVIARMGEGKARRVFMSSRIFGAEEAVSLDLLARTVAPEALDQAIEAEVTPYLNCAPGAVAAAKVLAQDLGARIDQVTIDHSIAALARQWEGDEAHEGIAAFFEKRKARWMV